MTWGQVTNRGKTAGRVVALDLGVDAVRAVEVEMRGETGRCLKRGQAPMPVDVWENPAETKDALAEAIRAALRSGGITPTRAVVCIPRRHVTLKNAKLPHATTEQVAGMVRFEAQQYVPFPVDEAVLSHEVVSEEGDELTTALIVGARQSLVDAVMTSLDRASVEVSRLTVSSLALAENARDQAVSVAVVSVDDTGLDIAVTCAGRVLFSRSAAVAAPTAAERSALLATETARSLAAYQNEYRSGSVSHVFVAGTSAAVAAYEEALQKVTDIPADRLRSQLLPAGDSEAGGYAVALGLAIQEIGNSHGINLVPSSRSEKRDATRKRANTALAAAAVVVVLIGGFAMIQQSSARQQAERTAALRENQRLKTAQEALQRSKTTHDGVDRTYRAVKEGLTPGMLSVEVVKALSDALPAGHGLFLTQLTFERNGAMTLRGTAKSESAAVDLTTALQKSPVFQSVRLGYLGDAQTEAVNTITGGAAAIKRSKAGESKTFTIACRLADGQPTPPTTKQAGPTVASTKGGQR